jgi:hypothetical protein
MFVKSRLRLEDVEDYVLKVLSLSSSSMALSLNEDEEDE